MPLQLNELDRVVVLSAGSDGMGAIVTAFAENSAVAYRLAIQRLAGRVRGSVTVAALWLVEPGIGILGNSRDRAVAVGAVRSIVL